AYTLLTMILDRFLPTGPVVIGIDDTIERRWGRKIAAHAADPQPQMLRQQEQNQHAVQAKAKPHPGTPKHAHDY
ncbi:MAG: hypothetical protein WBL41_15230, partial [Terracidiphilus sp.]